MKIIQLILLLSTLLYVQPWGLTTFTDVIKSGTDTGKGIARKIPTLIPSPEGIFKLGLDGLIGLPLQAFADAINQICNYISAMVH